MKFVLFYHSFTSCWNHGNAHFLRGIARELIERGNAVTVYEPADGWSRVNALADGAGALAHAAALVPGVDIQHYCLADLDLDAALDRADIVLAHEWNDPALIAALGRARKRGGKFILFFHDTHHRAVTAPHEIARFDLDGYDAVLAFGEVLREIYLRRDWAQRAFTWHEAADTALFRPLARDKNVELAFVGNWGDGERDGELRRFLLDPIMTLGLSARIYGVRYPQSMRSELKARGIDYAGWLPNHHVPEAFAHARATMHVPRRPYAQALVGIPTIRVFEALACGIPLVTAPWDDAEGLFPAGSYVTVDGGAAATAALALVLADADYTAHLVRTGLQAIRTRHSCAHRVTELFAIIANITSPHVVEQAAWTDWPEHEPSRRAAAR